jgi:hypothetical protein
MAASRPVSNLRCMMAMVVLLTAAFQFCRLFAM